MNHPKIQKGKLKYKFILKQLAKPIKSCYYCLSLNKNIMSHEYTNDAQTSQGN